MAKHPPIWYPEKSIDKPSPAAGLPRVWFILCTHFSKIVLLNLLYLLFCIPIFTIPAATAGMTNVIMKLWREGNCFLWADFWQEFKTEFASRMFIWFAMQILPLLFCLIPAYLGAREVAFCLSLIAELLVLLVDAYWFPLIVTMNVSSLISLKNSCLLIPLAFRDTIKIFLIQSLFYGLGFLLFPYTLPVSIILSFSVSRLLLCVFVYPVMERWIIREEEH